MSLDSGRCRPDKSLLPRRNVSGAERGRAEPTYGKPSFRFCARIETMDRSRRTFVAYATNDCTGGNATSWEVADDGGPDLLIRPDDSVVIERRATTHKEARKSQILHF